MARVASHEPPERLSQLKLNKQRYSATAKPDVEADLFLLYQTWQEGHGAHTDTRQETLNLPSHTVPV
jgi:hypothetical protein